MIGDLSTPLRSSVESVVAIDPVLHRHTPVDEFGEAFDKGMVGIIGGGYSRGDHVFTQCPVVE